MKTARKERPILFAAPMVRATMDDRKTQTRRPLKVQPKNPGTFGLSPIWGSGVPNGKDAFHVHAAFEEEGKRVDRWLPCPYGKAGDRLWGRETWYCDHIFAGDFEKTRIGHTTLLRDADCIKQWQEHLYYRADAPKGTICELMPECECDGRSPWRPSIFMPRWASRIDLEITDIRIEQLQDISQVDAIEEGVMTLGDDWIAAHFPEYHIAKESTPKGAKPPLGPSPRMRFKALWIDIHGPEAWNANPWVWAIKVNRISNPSSKYI